MKKQPGKAALALLTILCIPHSAFAALSAEVDRNRIAMGDTLRLTIIGTDGEEVGETDLQPLLENFEILQRSSSSNFSFGNGQRSNTKKLLIDLSPLKEGLLVIPALRVEKEKTQPLRVAVTPPPDINTGGQPVLFEAIVDRDQVYVQGQLILTMRLSLAINLESGSIGELELDNAFVRQLERNSFLRTIDGRPWHIHEVRYAVFPEQSGELVIPAQAFSGRISEGRRGLFDLNRGQLLRRNSEPVSVQVLARPNQFDGSTWLPARNLTIEENWSVPPEQLRAGESATRTIRIVGEGLQGAQLPPIFFPQQEGLKYYPDQPQISEQEMTSGLQGVRMETAALVPTRAGQWTIPEVRIPWWDTQAKQVRYALLPARDISVIATSVPGTSVTPQATSAGPVAVQGNPASLQNILPWQIASLIATLGWVITGVLYWRRRGGAATTATNSLPQNTTERDAFRKLIKACQLNNALVAREALLNWAATRADGPERPSLSSLDNEFSDSELSQALKKLETGLYSTQAQTWQGDELAKCLKRARDAKSSRSGGSEELRLYPNAN
ncbi:MAG: hypothetical protein ACI9NT_000737 [Bacteroidia bacterium]|jgi:hypothetical protein